jgi:hypothetical protein
MGDQTNKNKQHLAVELLDLEAEAKEILSLNDRGTFTVPNGGLYPHQWLWDSCFIAIGQANYDVHRAEIEIKSLFKGQWSNGMMPSIVLRHDNHINPPGHDRHDNIWRSWLNPYAPSDFATSGITQPPMLAEAITRIGAKMNKHDRRLWYKQVFHGLVDYHKWLYQERDPHGEGLVLLIHPWETGLDNTPPWVKELNEHLLPWWIRFLHTIRFDHVVGWFRSDNEFVAKNERLSNQEAMAYYSVQRRLRRKNYDFDKYINHSLFTIEDLTFNCILIRANQLLIEMAEFIGEELDEQLLESIEKSKKALNNLWDEYSEEYFTRDFLSHRLFNESSIAAFMPLYSGAISKERAKVIVSLLENEHRFGTNFPVPSVPLDSAFFSAKRYWQGPTWVNTNWLIIEGLKRYGFNDHAEALKESTLDMIKQSGFFEYFNPLSGEGLGVGNFSWTAALYIDLINN